MPPLAFVFPGQGVQRVGMGRALAQTYAQARTTFEEADDLLGYSLQRLCFEGPEGVLNQTVHAQPAVFVHSVAALRVLEAHGYRPGIAAGASLGEYGALVAARVLTFAEALHLVSLQARLMSKTPRQREGIMASILGLEADHVAALCQEAEEHGLATIAVHYGGKALVISGDRNAVTRVLHLAKRVGARRCREIRHVQGAFHTPLMQEVRDTLEREAQQITFRTPVVPVVSSVTGTILTSAEACRESLVEHVSAPVQWARAVHTMWSTGIRQFVEVGAGYTLSNSIVSLLPQVRCISVDMEGSLNKLQMSQ